MLARVTVCFDFSTFHLTSQRANVLSRTPIPPRLLNVAVTVPDAHSATGILANGEDARPLASTPHPSIGSQSHFQPPRFVSEVQSVVGLVSIPDARPHPLAIFVAALFNAGEDQAIGLATLGRREVHAHSLAGEQELIGSELR